MPLRTNFKRGHALRRVKRKQRDRILIVCEDTKHTVAYVRALCRDIGLSAAEVAVYSGSGSSPRSVYEYAKKRMRKSEEEDGDNAFDWAYCVFDKDHHSTFKETLALIKKENKIRAITCIPCFEFWILIHFVETAQPMQVAEPTKRIKKYIPEFDKRKSCYADLYHTYLKERMAIAIKHSKRVLKEVGGMGGDNPSTNMHELVEYLVGESNK